MRRGGTDQAHHRIHPECAKVFASEQGRDREQRGQGICQNVQIGRFQIVIVLMVMMTRHGVHMLVPQDKD